MKNHRLLLLFLVISLFLPGFGGGILAQKKSLPLYLENKGQILDQELHPNTGVYYLLNSQGKNIQLRATGFSIDSYSIRFETPKMDSLAGDGIQSENPLGLSDTGQPVYSFQRTDIEFEETNPSVKIITGMPSSDYLNYYTTGTGEEGVTYIRGYREVIYQDFYTGTDLVFQADSLLGVTCRFVFKDGFGKEAIKVRINNIEKPADTLLAMNVFNRISPDPGTDIHPESALTTDPERKWGTYYGGDNSEFCFSTAIDKNGNVFLGGSTYSPMNIATAGSYQTLFSGPQDVYLVKFDSNGVRQWGTYYGGPSFEHGGLCGTDHAGNVYLHGETESQTNIATTGSHQSVYAGGGDCFLVKFNSNGIRQWGTYYGGPVDEQLGNVATDSSGNVCIVGYTISTTGISSPGSYQVLSGGGFDSFLAKFNTDGVRQWGTYYGGTADDDVQACAFDKNGNLFICGLTKSVSNIASPGSHQDILSGDWDSYLVKFNGAGVRQWATYYGGTDRDRGWSCATDGTGNVFLSGDTYSNNNISTPGSYQELSKGGDDAFLVKFSPTGVRQWGTFFGGAFMDECLDVSADAVGNAFISGVTNSPDYIATAGAFQTVYGGNSDTFLAKFNASGQREWGTYYGGSNTESGWASVIDKDWHIYFCGQTFSPENISTPGSHQTGLAGQYDGFLVKFQDCEPPVMLNQPSDTTLCEGTNGLLWVSAIGTSLAYQWQEKSGTGYINLTNTGPYLGTTSSQLIINGTETSMNGKVYRCQVSGSCLPWVASDSAVLWVNPKPVPTVSGPVSVCSGTQDNLYFTEAGMTAYLWSVSPGATIQSGLGTSAVTVTWNTAGAQTVGVSYTNSLGCSSIIPAFFNVAVIATPSPPAITASLDTLKSNTPYGNQWFYEGGILFSATAQTYLATQTGWYWDVVTLEGCPSDTSNHLFLVISGIEGEYKNEQFLVFPSPNEGHFSISMIFPADEKITLRIMNNSGIPVYEKKDISTLGNQAFQVGISVLSPGIYYAIIENSTMRRVRKVVVLK